jgi:chemotaxis protein methyltransferase CheR
MEMRGRRDGGGGSGAHVLGVSDSAFALLRDLISQRTGVFFADDRRDLLADKLADLLAERGMTSYLDLYYLLRYDPDAARHWSAVVDSLAVPETYFWRQPDQIHALTNVLAPRHFERWPGVPFRIWSAACCTGEEPLSIVIALAEAGLLDRHPFEIVASDASAAMIERARRGVYAERSFRALPPALRQRYFRSGAGGWHVDAALHGRISWTVANIVERAEVLPLATAHVIFCRNVLIYFSDETVAHVVHLFAEAMLADAHLCLGASESLTRLSTAFELVEIGGAFMYTKATPENGTNPGDGRGGARGYHSARR